MSPFLRLFRYTKDYRKEYLLATFFSILNKLFDIAPEILIGIAVDTVVKKESSWLSHWGIPDVTSQLWLLGVLTFAIWVGESVTEYLYAIRWRNLAQTLQHLLRLDCFRHVTHLDIAFFEQQRAGNLLSILNDDVNQLERFLEDGANQLIQVFMSSLMIGAIFFILTPKLALFAILPVPLILGGAFYFQRRMGPRFLVVREKAGLLNSRLANSIQGIMTVKSFTAESFEVEQVEKDSQLYRQANRHAIALSSMITPIIRMGVLAGFLATLLYGGWLTLEGHLAVGSFSVLVFLTQRLLWPFTRLAEITIMYQRARASIQRIMDLLSTPQLISHAGAEVTAAESCGDIGFDQLSFAYDAGRPVLHHVTLTIPAGTSLGIVGETGSGKSTLIKLLLRFYQPTTGRITLSGTDIRQFSTHALRQQIGVVSQEVFLFHGTVAENIAYAMEDTTRDAIIAAAKAAEAHDFIMQLPQAYDTMLGERGQNLSGGQRQRLAIARAILKNPPILILDEATSAVDNETEWAIQHSLDHIITGRTTLMIAHRLSTIRNADKIIVLDKGAIVEEGTHASLLATQGIYAHLWKLQTGER